MAETFLAMEADEQAGEHPDLFLTFEAPFANAREHGYFLRNELVTAFREGSAELEKDGVDVSWQPPTVRRNERDIPFLIRTCASFYEHLKLTRHLVLVLRPEAVVDPEAYQLWLHQWAVEAPANQRALIFDDARAPAFVELCKADPKRVWARSPELNMPAAMEELSQAGGNLDTPGGQYRDLFVRMGTAFEKQDLTLASSLGDQALAIAASQGWFHMAVPIQFALGAALLGAGRAQEAIGRYAAAEKSAEAGETEGQEELRPTCKRLRMQARLGRGSALVAAKAWGMAAQLYEETATLAAELDDKRTQLDCHRLAAFSYEQGGKPDQAWRAGLPGLQVARDMDEETRNTSSFPYLGEGLMRLCQSGDRRGLAPRIEREIVGIAGTLEWRPKPVAAETEESAKGRGGAS